MPNYRSDDRCRGRAYLCEVVMFFAPEKLSENRSLTPEGFLLCEGVPIARTGEQRYHYSELGGSIQPAPDGSIIVYRSPEEVFRPETVASANGKPLINEHPTGLTDITPENWKDNALGVVMNARPKDSYLVADLLVTTQEGKELINRGKVELSCGYDAQYEQTDIGRGIQTNIVINHVALVVHGRCGFACSIGDGSLQDNTMSDRKFTDEDIKAHIDQNAKEHAEMTDRIAALESALKAPETTDDEALVDAAKKETGKEVDKTMDSSVLSTCFKNTVAGAEVIIPGVRTPTFDATSPIKQGMEDLGNFRRSVLDLAYTHPDTRKLMDDVLNGKKLDTRTMTHDAVTTMFDSLYALRKNLNIVPASTPNVSNSTSPRAISLASMNKANQEYWKSQSA